MRRTKLKNTTNSKANSIKKAALFVAALTAILLTGCGGQGLPGRKAAVQEAGASENTMQDAGQQDNIAEDNNERNDDNISDDNTDASRDEDKALYQGTYRSSILQEDAEYLYLCGSYRIVKIDKKTGSTEVLWENRKMALEQKAYLYCEGSGLLLGDRLYFIERWSEDGQYENRALSCIDTDGGGYERIDELVRYNLDGMLLQDGILYLDGDDEELLYQVYADGTLSKQETLPVEDVEQIYYQNNGAFVVFQEEQAEVPEKYSLCSFNEQYFVVVSYDAGEGPVLTIIERDTGKERKVGSIEGYSHVICIENTDAYVLRIVNGEEGNTICYIYEKLSLETGERTVLFTQEKTGLAMYVSRYLMDVVVKGGYLYYVDELDGKYYVMRRDINHPEQAENVGDAFYDTGISSVGSVQYFYKEYYTEKYPDKPGYVVNLSWLQVDERFPGAGAVNARMEEYKKAKVDWAETDFEGQKDWLTSDEMAVCSELDSTFNGFDYFDSRYISFVQSEYEYMSGAAHGMPYWKGFTFDLQTGKQLVLSDIIGDSEEELKEIVASYFEEKINQNPEDFWTEALDVVRENISLDSDFYLTEQGIVFYFGPYELACYAAGFQTVTIPYDEFAMKISLEKVLQEDGAAANEQNAAGEKNQELAEQAGKLKEQAGKQAARTDNLPTQAGELPELQADGEGWGLSFGEQGEQPVGNESVDTLAQYNAYYLGSSEEKVIYLTFDCGYENGNTEPILDALKKHDVQATFFVVGHFLESAPELVQRMVDEGHTVGSHTYNHPDVTTLSETAFCEEMDAVRDKFREVTGEELSMYYRPPEGKCSGENMKWAQEMGYATFFWSLAHVDWDADKQPSQKEAMEKLTSRVHPGAVVLLHNTSRTNGEILDELLTKWEEMGYEVRPLEELIR